MDDTRYTFHERSELLELVPDTARVIVDVGCGEGRLGAAIKARSTAVQVRGVELDRRYAARAAAVLDEVHVGCAEEGMPAAWPAPDCLIFADVLEHLIDPWSVLRTWRDQARDGVVLLVSVPNVAHWTTITSLLKGGWDYADLGILDRTHLRFFTGPTAVELIEGAGFAVEGAWRVIDRLPQSWRAKLRLADDQHRFVRTTERPGRPSRLRQRGWDLLTYQFLFRARRR